IPSMVFWKDEVSMASTSGEKDPTLTGKKPKISKQEIDRAYRARKKGKEDSMKAKIVILEENKCRLEGRADQLEKDLKESRKENIRLEVHQERQNKRQKKLERNLIALGEQYKREMDAIKETHAEEINALKERNAEEVNASKERNAEEMLALKKQL
ncbi:unnamed protein product, partial [Dovyalis caffra]